MCGICGEIKFDNTGIDKRISKKMINEISRRGPDNEGLFFNENVFLGHKRLSVIDVSKKSNQPMIDQFLKMIIVFNGVIYNYKELRNKLEKEGYKFFSDGDTEVIIKSYHFFGEDCIKYLDGVFAFCIYNTEEKKFFLARDRLGIKPLYYQLNKNFFRFSSSLNSLLKTDDNSTEIDHVSLHYQFTLHSVIPAPRTILKNFNKLEPGHFLVINSDGKYIKKRFYSFENIKIDANISEIDALEETERLLILSIKKRLLTSDVPVGILLSGGLDSSMIVALASKHCGLNINTYSIGFPSIENEKGDEYYYSDKISKKFETKHHKYALTTEDLFKNLDEVIACMSEPMVSQDSSAFFLLAREVSKRQKVVLSGQGADELFGGYFWYEKMEKQNLNYVKRFSQNYFDRNHNEYYETIESSFHGKDHSASFIESFLMNEKSKLDFLDKVFRMDLSTLIVDDPIKRVDNMTMSWGLETRVPYLDLDLIEFVLKIPSKLKVKNNGKFHLKKIAEKYLENKFINREKYYFPVPPLKIIKDNFLDYMKDILGSEKCKQRGIFDRKYVKKLLNGPNKYYTKLNGNKLWHLALFERWFQLNVDVQ